MVINILSIEKSEFELKENFLAFLAMCLKMHQKVFDFLDSEDWFDEKKMEYFYQYKMRSKEKKAYLRDDCIWIISKDQPRANHLRFVVAILYSIVNLDQIVQQNYAIVKNLYKQDLPLQFKKVLLQTSSESVVFFEEFVNWFVDVQKKNFDLIYEKFSKKSKIFQKDFQHKIMHLNDWIIKKRSFNVDNFYVFSLSMRYIDKIIDYLILVLENFLMIRNY